jgi:hypothetical protein
MDEESQIEQLTSAHRERSALEAAQDEEGLSTTARAVLARIERG